MVAPSPRERLRISPRSAVLSVAMFGATLGLLAVVAASQRVIGWILVAATLAGLLHPIVTRLARHMPRAAATALVMAVFVGTIGTVVYRLVDDIQRETRRLQEAGPERARQIERSDRFGDFARDIKLAERTDRFLKDLPERLRGGTPAEALQAAATRGVAFLATGVLTIFFLQHGPRLARSARDQIRDEDRRARLQDLGIAVYRRAFGYASATLTMSLAAGLFAYVAGRTAEVPGPAALGVWVGLWDLVPLAGALIGALPIVVLAAAISGDRAWALVAIFVAYQVIENVGVQRRVERATVRVGPFVTLAAGIVGLELSGAAGALLSVLAATIVVTAADELAGPDEQAEQPEQVEQDEQVEQVEVVDEAPVAAEDEDAAHESRNARRPPNVLLDDRFPPEVGMTFVLRRSLPSIGGLIGLLLAVGFAVVAFLGAPVWFPVAFAVVVLAVQYLVNPWIIQWLVPATVIPHDGGRYATDHPLGEIVARRCAQAGIPLVTLGIVDDGNPNAFTFGRRPKDARMWVTRGLLERLDERELDAVVAHEVGHVKHWDFAVMTVAAVVPMALYLAYIVARGSNRNEARAVAIGAYVAYLVSQLTLLALSRARETSADHWSCEATADGDALASALVKVAYGMGQVNAAQKEEARALIAQGKAGRREAAALSRRAQRAQSMRAMGIFEPRSAEALQAAFAQGIDPERALAAMRWDAVNPWGATLEKLSSHPLVARRIQALEESGLPGAPRQWSVLRAVATASPEQVFAARARFARELAIALAPWVALAAAFFLGFLPGSRFGMGLAVAVAGLLFFVKQNVRYPGEHQPVDEVAGLLERLDAGPVTGIPVTVKGQIVGRGMPGYVLSPDLVVADSSGFVPLLYRQPLPFAAELFGLFRAQAFQGQEVVARGWYRRLPGPAIELREVRAADGRRARAWEWVARYAAAVVLVVAGVALMLVGLV